MLSLPLLAAYGQTYLLQEFEQIFQSVSLILTLSLSQKNYTCMFSPQIFIFCLNPQKMQVLYNSVKGMNCLLLRITGQIFLSGKLCLYCKSMALVLCTHSNMLTFIALFTPGSKSVIRSRWADNQGKLVTAPSCSEAVG